MPTTVESRRGMLSRIAEQILHNNPAGRRLVAVEGTDPDRATRFADDLADVLRDEGQQVARRSLGPVEEGDLRRDIVDPFRDGSLPGAGDDTLLLADGERLMNSSVIGIWHYTVWALSGDGLPHADTSIIAEVSDEDAPWEYYYDLCKLPPSVGERN